MCYCHIVSADTSNKSVTKMKIGFPERMLPVLIRWPEERKDRSGKLPYVGLGVRQLNPRDLDLYLTKKKKFEEMYGQTDADAKELLFILRLADAIADRSLPRVRGALERFLGPEDAKKELHHPAGFNALRELSLRLDGRMIGALPTVYWSDEAGSLMFGLYCNDISPALYLLAVEKVGVGLMGQCRGCRGVLLKERANKQFCDDNCRSRYNMQRLRERRKQAAKSKPKRHSRKGVGGGEYIRLEP